jgi:uncharacterized protein with HEPN domain
MTDAPDPTERIVRYLRDILAYLNDVEQFTTDGFEAFSADRRTQFAVIRAYEVVGEIVKRLPEELLVTQPTVQWQSIKGFRDFLIHNYDQINLVRVWDAVRDLPNLRAAIEVLLQETARTSPPE